MTNRISGRWMWSKCFSERDAVRFQMNRAVSIAKLMNSLPSDQSAYIRRTDLKSYSHHRPPFGHSQPGMIQPTSFPSIIDVHAITIGDMDTPSRGSR
jgi:hypothetical protein